MSHSNTILSKNTEDQQAQQTPQWADLAIESLGHYLDQQKHEHGLDSTEVFTGPTRAALAAIIARHAPLDVTRSRNEYRDKFDAAFAEKIAAQNRISELEAENARLRETLRRIEGKSWSGLYPEDGYENPKP